MFCRNCGNELSPSSAFCSKCGMKSEASVASPVNATCGIIALLSNSKRYLAMIAIVTIAVVALVFALGRSGIPNGRFYLDSVISEVEFAFPPAGFFEFSRGNRVVISNPFNPYLMSTGTYTYSRGVIYIQADGITIAYGIEVVDRNTLIVTLMGLEFLYVRDARPTNLFSR